MSDLKPCPFCGMDAKIIHEADDDGDQFYYVYCLGCDAETAGYETREEATNAWNRRAE